MISAACRDRTPEQAPALRNFYLERAHEPIRWRGGRCQSRCRDRPLRGEDRSQSERYVPVGSVPPVHIVTSASMCGLLAVGGLVMIRAPLRWLLPWLTVLGC